MYQDEVIAKSRISVLNIGERKLPRKRSETMPGRVDMKRHSLVMERGKMNLGTVGDGRKPRKVEETENLKRSIRQSS